jgi:hypothetical protein
VLVALVAALAACVCSAVSVSPARALLAAAALVLGLPPLARLSGVSPDSVRHVEWAGDGRWYVRDRSGARSRATLSGATTVAGPLVLLVWRDGAGRRRYALLDAGVTDPRAFRLLRGRLRFAGRGMHRAVDKCC